MGRNSSDVCPTELLDSFATPLERKLWQANGLMLVNAVLVGAMVIIGTFAPRSGRYTLIRYLLLGASTLFLPIVSNVAATIGGEAYFTSSLFGNQVVAARCEPGLHVVLVLVWTSLVVIIGINSSPVVAADAREGRSIEPPTELLIKAVWVLFLVNNTLGTVAFSYTSHYIGNLLGNDNKIRIQIVLILVILQLLPYVKILPISLSFYSARRSVEFGRNPRLIIGYMDGQIDDGCALTQHPALIVTGDQFFELVEKPHGYIARERSKPTGHILYGSLLHHYDDSTRVRRRKLVTLDKVWQLDDSVMRSQNKDLCFSFTLFKLLRCRFAKYMVSQAGSLKVSKFLWHEYLQGDNQERVFGLISDELSLIQCYYYSSQPLQYFNSGMAWTNMIITLITFGFCLYLLVFISRAVHLLGGREQVICQVWCPGAGQTSTPQQSGIEFGEDIMYGNTYYDFVPVCLVLVVLLLSEARNIVSCIGSNWSKVAIICGYLRSASASWLRSPCFQNCICFVLKRCRRSRLVNLRVDRMNQSSVLVLHPWETSVLPRRLFGFLGLANKKTINVPSEVKQQIYNALKTHAPASEQEAALNKRIPPPSHPLYKPSMAGDGGKVDIASTVLMWHVATSIFEESRQPPTGAHDQPHRTTATILSRYCAYLVAHRPDLLPEEDEWCKKLYKDAQQEASRVLRKSSMDSLKGNTNIVLKDGAELAEQLMKNQNTGWQELAGLWSEMILYLAPSENLDGHAEAIARGGEFITLLWALLTHAGIVDRNDTLAPMTSSRAAAAADHV